MAYYVPRHCLPACLERAEEGSGFITRLSQLLASADSELGFDKDRMFICALLSSASGSALVREGGDSWFTDCSYAERLYVLRAELRLGPSPALAWAWAGPPTRRARRSRSTTACWGC